jgi:pyruvate/2-oxoglutarate/acetoin dehydrogenase E1 component
MPRKSIRQALNEALRQEMRRDPRVIVIGEDVAGAPVLRASATLTAGCSASPRG